MSLTKDYVSAVTISDRERISILIVVSVTSNMQVLEGGEFLTIYAGSLLNSDSVNKGE
jgi:hypothetical protein